MGPAYALQESRCYVPWPTKAMARPLSVRLRLLERSLSPWPEPLGTWEYGPIPTSIGGLHIDLWRLDYYSAQLQLGDRKGLAKSYWRGDNLKLSDRLGLELTVQALDNPEKLTYTAELLLTADELRKAKQRFHLSKVPPIEWFFVELTNCCNFRCAWCPKVRMGRPQGIMPLEQAKGLLREIASYRQRHPSFSLYAEIRNPIFLHVMGEPLLHPHFFDIVEYGRGLGLDFCLVTNASLLKGDLINRLLDSELSSVVLSLNAPDAASFQPTGAPLSYELLVKQIQDFIRERYRRRTPLPRIEIQLLNSARVAIPDCSLVEKPDQVAAQLEFWSGFVREQERTTGAVRYVLDANEPLRWPTVLEHEANDPDTYFALGENISLVFKQACNFANELLPENHSVQETQRGECSFRNAHRVLCICWDGSATFCSLDYDNETNLGNVFVEGIDAIWAGERMCRIRETMEHGILIEPLCRRCLGKMIPQIQPKFISERRTL